jgi:predicted ATPase
MIHILTSVSQPINLLRCQAKKLALIIGAKYVVLPRRPHIYEAENAETLVKLFDDKKSIVCPTDSEMVLLRLMKMVREKRLNSSEVQMRVYFRVDDKLTYRIVNLNGRGKFINLWPDGGFFSARTKELF